MELTPELPLAALSMVFSRGTAKTNWHQGKIQIFQSQANGIQVKLCVVVNDKRLFAIVTYWGFRTVKWLNLRTKVPRSQTFTKEYSKMKNIL